MSRLSGLNLEYRELGPLLPITKKGFKKVQGNIIIGETTVSPEKGHTQILSIN